MNRGFLGLFLCMVGMLAVPIWWLKKAFFVTANITLHQVVFWGILIFIPIVLLQAYQKWRWDRIEIHWRFFVPIWVAFFFVYYTVGLFYFSGIADKSIINAQAVGGTWEESYTAWRTEEVCDSRDKDGNCTSPRTVQHCDDYNPDSYAIHFSDNSDHSIDSGNYQALVKQFKNQREVSSTHPDQCSVGDGRTFVTNFQSGKSNELYVSYEIPVVNYILAGHNLYQTSNDITRPFVSKLQKIPGIVEHPAGIGPWRSHQLLVSEVQMPEAWRMDMESWLNKFNGSIGPYKEVNVVIYIVGVSDRAFSQALEAYWTHGKKNQLTIVVGSAKFPVIDWVDVIDFWSTTPEIRINLRDRLQQIKLDDPQLQNIIEKEVLKNWNRREMRTFEYLAWDLTIPWWSYILIIVSMMVISGTFGWAIPRTLSYR